jgi:predicted DsbA family dithiol-disulfide isomerase
MADAANAGINSTPNFVVGLIDGKDARNPSIKVLRVITGARPYAVFKAALDSALAAQNQ